MQSDSIKPQSACSKGNNVRQEALKEEYINQELTNEEWNELNALRKAITLMPSSVHPLKMDRFSALYARALCGKADKNL